MLIGMNPDLGDTFCNSLTTQCDATRDQLSTLQRAVDTLQASWQGNSRTTFENEWAPWVQDVGNLMAQMQDMRDRLSRTIAAFREADRF